MINVKRPPSLSIMGIRGLPARHGGFETFAARLAPYLALAGWRVTVYCQEDPNDRPPALPSVAADAGFPVCAAPRTSDWQGVRRVHIDVGPDTALNSIRFDWACVRHALAERPQLVLTLGYNTAVFGLALRAAGIRHVINMDGIEWSRSKWGPLARAWLYLNDWAGCLGGDHLLADHPEIARHLTSRVPASKITMIPYGTDVDDVAVAGDADADPLEAAEAARLAAADAARLAALCVAGRPAGLAPGAYVTLIARPEPENSVLDIVRAFSARRRGLRLVVLGAYVPSKFPYHAQVMAAASDEVLFAGAIYDPDVVGALRRRGLLYLHGHRVGGTNPSLLEAMGAANAVLAHDNRFNRWVAADGAHYFRDAGSCRAALDALLADPAERARLAAANHRRARQSFRWADVLASYQVTLTAQLARAASAGVAPATVDTALSGGSAAVVSAGAAAIEPHAES